MVEGVLPKGFQKETLVSAVEFSSLSSEPMDLTFFPDGRLLVVERTGIVWILDPSQPLPLGKEMYLTLVDKLYLSLREVGVFSALVDSKFNENRYVYFYYSSKEDNGFRISRFEHQENQGGTSSRALVSSETRIWADPIKGQCVLHEYTMMHACMHARQIVCIWIEMMLEEKRGYSNVT